MATDYGVCVHIVNEYRAISFTDGPGKLVVKIFQKLVESKLIPALKGKMDKHILTNNEITDDKPS